jgi:ornithine decarboxylase
VRARYSDVSQLLRQKSDDLPVFCFIPHRIQAATQRFRAGFPGKVLYAIKANPDRDVLGWIAQAGIDAFDTASIPEIALAKSVVSNAHCAYNHPVKPRASLVTAYKDWGVRDFVVDHAAELQKLFQELDSDIVVQVRVATPNSKARVSFNEKFGAMPAEAASLLRAIKERGAIPALTMHVGWQTVDPQAFAAAVRLLATVAAEAGVRPHYLNVGGGFPSLLMPSHLRIEDFFEAISSAHASETALAGVPLRCEPGSAIVTTGGGVLTQVLLVKEQSIYLNDGIYGALAELLHSKMQPPTRVYTRDGEERTGTLRSFRTFGPTCDSFDASPAPFEVPISTREGDWLYLESMGAYSAPLITNFNGLGAHDFAILDSAP